MQRNRLMLEETRDIVTVPASMIIRMLGKFSSQVPVKSFAKFRSISACLHSYNRNTNSADNQDEASSS